MAEIVNVAVIWVALTTVTLLTVTPVEETVTGPGGEVRAGEGDGDRGALQAARRERSRSGLEPERSNAAVDLDFTQADVGAGGIVDGKRTHVIVRAAKDVLSAEPSFGSCPTATLLPSLKVNVPASTLSMRLGRSYSAMRETVTGEAHCN